MCFSFFFWFLFPFFFFSFDDCTLFFFVPFSFLFLPFFRLEVPLGLTCASVKNYQHGYATGNVVLSVPKAEILKQKGPNALVRLQLHKCDLASPQLLSFALAQAHIKRLTSQTVHCSSDLYCLDMFDVLVMRHAPGADETRLVRTDLTCELNIKTEHQVAFLKQQTGFPLFSCVGTKRLDEPPYEAPGIRRFPRFNVHLDENGGI